MKNKILDQIPTEEALDILRRLAEKDNNIAQLIKFYSKVNFYFVKNVLW